MLRIVCIEKHVFDLTTPDGPALARAELTKHNLDFVEIQNAPYEDLEGAQAAGFAGMEPANMKFYREILEPRGRV